MRTLVLLAAAAVAAAAATAAEPTAAPAAAPSVASLTGFGAVKFGATVEEARKAWPAMAVLHQDIKMPSAAFTSPFLERFVIRKHAIAGLASPVDVELRFWEGKLWAFLVYFEKADMNAALQHLEKTYGPRTSGIETRPIWRGEAVTLQAMAEAGWYGATDNAISDKARAWFFKELTGNPQGQQAAQPAPGAESAPGGGTAAPAAATAAPATTPQATQPAAPPP
jgi:hypothetical protein